MKKRTSSSITVVHIVVAVTMITIAILITAFTSFNDHTYVATVTNKDRIVKKDSDGDINSYYLIFCKDDAGNYYELKNEDLFIRGKFQSSTVYNQLEIGQKYKFTVVGYRIGLFSAYENIIKFEKVD